MKKEIEKLVKDPDSKTVLYELTPERKKELVKISNEIIDILGKRCSGPPEAAVVVHFLQEALEQLMGAKLGAFIIVGEDEVQS